jgi:hypothetical protein
MNESFVHVCSWIVLALIIIIITIIPEASLWLSFTWQRYRRESTQIGRGWIQIQRRKLFHNTFIQ